MLGVYLARLLVLVLAVLALLLGCVAPRPAPTSVSNSNEAHIQAETYPPARDLWMLRTKVDALCVYVPSHAVMAVSSTAKTVYEGLTSKPCTWVAGERDGAGTLHWLVCGEGLGPPSPATPWADLFLFDNHETCLRFYGMINGPAQ